MKKLIGFGHPAFPSPTAKRGEQVGVSPLRRCVQCGCNNDTRKQAWSDEAEAAIAATGVPQAGCRFCGSLLWVRGKPVALPDDTFLPTKGRKSERTGGE